MSNITFIDLFSGIGGFRLGLEGAGFECKGWCEKEENAQQAYRAIFNTEDEWFAEDISEVDPDDVPDVDMYTGGFPCFPANTSIITKEGRKNIEDIEVGEQVLTHKGRFKPVIETMEREYSDKMFEINLPYNINISATKNHPFLARKESEQLDDDEENNTEYLEPEWVKAENLNTEHYIGVPIPKEEDLDVSNFENEFGCLKEIWSIDLDDGLEYVWLQVKEINVSLQSDTPVFDLTVEEDHSFVAEGLAVHNCQSFSLAGNRAGFEDTRGSLFFQIARLAKANKPKYLLLENVKGLLSQDNGEAFRAILNTLMDMGYEVEWQILNSKNFGVPQNRERVFILAHRDDFDDGVFPIEGNTDASEDTVKYLGGFLGKVEGREGVSSALTKNYGFCTGDSTKVAEKRTPKREKLVETKVIRNKNGNGKEYIEKDFNVTKNGDSYCIDSCYHKGMSPEGLGDGRRTHIMSNKSQEIKKLGNIYESNGQNGNVYNPDGISPCLQSGQGDKGRGIGSNNSPKILQQDEKQEDDEESEVTALTERRTEKAKKIRRKYQQKYGRDYCPRREKKVVPREDDVANCVTSTQSIEQKILNKESTRIRKLTPLECFRLQGFPDWSFRRAKNDGVSDTRLYELAGNAVTTTVVKSIGENLKDLEEG